MANATNIAGYSMDQDPTAPNLILEGGGEPVPGYTFTPHITSIAGGYRLSWTNDGGLTNPNPVDIYQGSDGLRCYYFDNAEEEYEARELIIDKAEDDSIELMPRIDGAEYQQYFASPVITVDDGEDQWTLSGIAVGSGTLTLTGKDSEGINKSTVIHTEAPL